MHSLGLARIVTSVPGFTARPNKRKVQFSHTPGEAAAGPRQGRGHRAASTTAFPPQRECYSEHLPYSPRRRKATQSPYLNDPAGRRHLAAHHDPREGAASGALASRGFNRRPARLGRALPVTSRRRSGRPGKTLLHCGASPTHVPDTDPPLPAGELTHVFSVVFVLQVKICDVGFILFISL